MAALLRKGVNPIAAISISPSAPSGARYWVAAESQPAISSVAPVVWSASLTGIKAPNKISAGHSIAS